MQHRKQTDLKDRQNTVDNDIKRRLYSTETRADKADDGKMTIGGYASIFNQYTNMGWYAEVIMPGFFEGIKDDRCACLLNHEESQILGRKKNNTLALKIDEKGLDYESILPSHRSDVFELIRDGYVYESSFAFTIAVAKWAEVDRSELAGLLSDTDLDQLTYGGKITVRYLEKGRELFDVSPVTFAAYEGTTTDTRVAAFEKDNSVEKRSFEAWKAANKTTENTDTDNETPPEPSRRMRLIEALERSNR